MPAGASAVATRREVPTEVSRGHSSPATRGEGPNRNLTMEAAPLPAVARPKEPWETARLSGNNPSETGMAYTSVSSSASGESHSIEP